MQTRRQKRLSENQGGSKEKKRQRSSSSSVKNMIQLLPLELLYIICRYLSRDSLIKLCAVSTTFQNRVQPLIPKVFISDLYSQRGLWERLAKLAKALENPSPGWGIDHIDIELGQLEDVEKLAKRLRPILSRATNLRSLSIPIHSSTAKLLESCGFCDFGEDLNVQKVFQTIFSLNRFTFIRGFSGHLGIEWRSDELQDVEIGKCQLNHESILRLLKRFKNLVTVKLQGVDLWHHLPLSRKSKLAAIVEALYPSRRNLCELTLNIEDSCIASKSEVLGAPSLGAFSSLKNFTAHESDLSADVIFPPSMIRLGVLSFEREPTFSFFGRDYTSLPKTLRTVLSYSRKPAILQERLKEIPPPDYIKVEIRRYDDSLPRGAIRRPDKPS